MNTELLKFEFLPSFIFWLKLNAVIGVILLILRSLAILVGGGNISQFGRELVEIFGELTGFSISRLYAITKLTVLEAVRRRVLLVFVVVGILFMFAGWFLTDSGQSPEFQVQVNVAFVFFAISWPLTLIAIMLSCWGLPEDIKQRSLHTVVTKPTTRFEIVVGRVLGILTVCWGILLILGGAGLFWIYRVTPANAQSALIARRPVYGALEFRSREGAPVKQGSNTGDINEFRSFIEGATKARAVWEFNNCGPNLLDRNGDLVVETRFQVFRSYKGVMRRSVMYQMTLVNPDTDLRVAREPVEVNEFRNVVERIPAKVQATAAGQTQPEQFDLIKDLVSKNGKLRVEIACVDREQYLGMAPVDLFLRRADFPFWVTYLKGIMATGLFVSVAVSIGVLSSTFAKFPVASLLTFSLIMIGYTGHDFLTKLSNGPVAGGGTLESVYRIVTHKGPAHEMPNTTGFAMMKSIDARIRDFSSMFVHVIPNLGYFEQVPPFVNYGFDVPPYVFLPCVVLGLGYFVSACFIGYFCLRIRELESK